MACRKPKIRHIHIQCWLCHKKLPECSSNYVFATRQLSMVVFHIWRRLGGTGYHAEDWNSVQQLIFRSFTCGETCQTESLVPLIGAIHRLFFPRSISPMGWVGGMLCICIQEYSSWNKKDLSVESVVSIIYIFFYILLTSAIYMSPGPWVTVLTLRRRANTFPTRMSIDIFREIFLDRVTPNLICSSVWSLTLRSVLVQLMAELPTPCFAWTWEANEVGKWQVLWSHLKT